MSVRLYTSTISAYRRYSRSYFKRFAVNPIKPTYVSATEQMRAHRVLRSNVNAVLEPYGINATQWSILGFLFEQVDGIRPTDLANMLDVKAPLITMLAIPLAQMSLIHRIDQESDKRTRSLRLTAKGRSTVQEIESQLIQLGPSLFSGISQAEMRTYHKVLLAIIASEKNSSL